MYEEDSTVQLIGSKPRGANGHSRDGSRDQVFYLSDSELGSKVHDEDAFEETTVFSDSLYGDSLPSMRAQLAATQMQNRSRRRGAAMELENSTDEKKYLLNSEEGERSISTVVEQSQKEKELVGNHGQYSSLGGKIITSKKRAKKETIQKL